jgi:hypothetical protein
MKLEIKESNLGAMFENTEYYCFLDRLIPFLFHPCLIEMSSTCSDGMLNPKTQTTLHEKIP